MALQKKKKKAEAAAEPEAVEEAEAPKKKKAKVAEAAAAEAAEPEAGEVRDQVRSGCFFAYDVDVVACAVFCSDDPWQIWLPK